MPFFSSFTGSFSGGRRRPISIGGGGGGGAVSSADFSSTTLTYTLDNPNPYADSNSDQFGYVVAISTNYAIVTAPAEDEAGGSQSGKAYIFDLSDGSLLYTLDNPNPYGTSTDDRFANSVAINDSYAIVGSPYEDEAGGDDSGKAYIYNLSDGSLAYTLDNPNAYDTVAGDRFGEAVAINSGYVIVGASGEDDAGGTFSGKAYVFDLSDGSLTYTLDNPNAYNTSQADLFSQAVAMSESYAIVGAYTEDDAGGTTSGKAYVFDLSDGSLLYTLDNPNAYDTSANDRFANSVAINDSYAIVGAYFEDDAGGTQSGKAYIFDLSDGSLVNTLDNPNAYSTSAGDYFGISVGMGSGYVIVGARDEDDAAGTDSGKAYVYKGVASGGGGGAGGSPNIGTYTFANSFDTATQATEPKDLWFNDDGTKVFVADNSSNTIYRYGLSTGWDISTASYDSVSYSFSGTTTALNGLTFNADGTSFYIIGNDQGGTTPDSIFQFDMASAYDIANASLAGSGDTGDSGNLAVDSTPQKLMFNNDGTKLYIVGSANDTIYQYSLSSAYDITTISYDNVSASVRSQTNNPRGMKFGHDGTKIFILDSEGSSPISLKQYTLGTAYDLSTISSSVSSISLNSNGLIRPEGLYLHPDGTSFYVQDGHATFATAEIYQYNTDAL